MVEPAPRSFAFHLWPSGHADGVRGDIPLHLLRTAASPQTFMPLLFRFDTGADVTIMPVVTAQRMGVAVPDESRELVFTTAAGTIKRQVRVGALRVRIVHLGNELFDWPCLFTEDPAHPCVVGTAGVIRNETKRLRVTLDGASSREHPFGFMLLELITGGQTVGLAAR